MPDGPVSRVLPNPCRSQGAKEIRPTRETRQLKATPHRLLDIEGMERTPTCTAIPEVPSNFRAGANLKPAGASGTRTTQRGGRKPADNNKVK